MTRICIFLTLFVCGFSGFGQHTSTGQVFDLQTHEPIPFAHVVCGNSGTTTNLDGKFRIATNPGDTLIISHINYQPYRFIVNQSPKDSLVVFMIPLDVMLDEIMIGILPTEYRFKQEILENKVQRTEAEQAALATMRMAKILYLSGHTPEMNSLDNYKHYIREPQGVSILSSDPSKGLIKSLENIANYDMLFRPQFNEEIPDSLLAPIKLRDY